jgi:hypothetical protein
MSGRVNGNALIEHIFSGLAPNADMPKATLAALRSATVT